MSSKRSGRPPKRAKRNITGLRNQGTQTPIAPTPPKIPSPPPEPASPLPPEEDLLDPEEDDDTDHQYDSDEALNHIEFIEIDSDYDPAQDPDDEWDEVGTAEFQERLMKLALEMEEERRDALDLDWIPSRKRADADRAKKLKTARPKQYAKGPDVASKSKRTQRRYRNEIAKQTTLDSFFSVREGSSSVAQSSRNHSPIELDSSDDNQEPSEAGPSFPLPSPPPIIGRPRRASVLSSPSVTSGEDEAQSLPQIVDELGLNSEPDIHDSDPDLDAEPEITGSQQDHPHGSMSQAANEDGVDDWDAILDDIVDSRVTPGGNASQPRRGVEVRSWDILREQIKKDLKKKQKHLPLTQYNQLLILRNFATLRIKGFKRIEASLDIARQWHEGDGTHFARRVRALARHYQIFEQLPVETRGGRANTKSLLNDESVQIACRAWLTEQKAGTVTPKKFRHQINTEILPALGLTPRKDLSERTARRWLLRLGFRRTLIKKGVYMDGHERPDVVKYRDTVYLPEMAKYEALMTHYEGPELRPVEPVLPPGMKKVIAYFHDECCFHALDYMRSVWLADGQTVLQKKGRGRLIHVSDFITEATGRLVERDANGNIIDDARKIIYPGAKGDAWWDCEQLIEQVKHAIEIHDRVHPNTTALFIFDNSSAHGSLPPDALRAFDMNKSDGGKQRHQKDTVIPMSNPSEAQRGQFQKMTTDDGKPKGMQAVLEERGFNVSKMRAKCAPVCPIENTDCCMARLLSKQDDFANQVSMLESVIKAAGHACIFLPKFHCELNPIEMYWGWVKYRYRQIIKTTFDASKKLAVEYLDACPVETIRRFINRSWRCMSAYRRGLSGKALEWAVKAQKQHRSVSNRAMLSIESLLN